MEFTAKLNKKQTGVYVIEEELVLKDGKYEGALTHDNVVNSSIRVYSEPGMNGTQITNWSVSIPYETPWQRNVRIFASVPVVYVTYETPGDTVEAEDINELQEAIAGVKTELAAMDMSDVEARLNTVEGNKAEKLYVDQRLLAKVDKEVGKGLSSEDYTTAEKEKLGGIDHQANAYAHPATHPPSIISQNANNRFVTDAEKANWNAKETTGGSQAKANAAQAAAATDATNKVDAHASNVVMHMTAAERTSWNAKETPAGAQAKATTARDAAIAAAAADATSKVSAHTGNAAVHLEGTERVDWNAAAADRHSHGNKSVLDNMTAALVTAWNSAVTHISDAVRHITAAERTLWNTVSNKVDKIAGKGLSTEDYTTAEKNKLSGIAAGAQVNTVSSVAGKAGTVTLVKGDVGLGSVQNYPVATQAEAEAGTAANRYMTPQRTMQVVSSQMSEAGLGDMLKSVYDTDNDGVVDAAESVPWTGVTGKPSSMPANGGNSDTVDGKHASQMTARVNLAGSVQTSSYRRSVIALCEVTNTSPSLNSYSIGMLTFHRNNGLSGTFTALVGAEKRYNTSTLNFHGLYMGRTDNQVRPCTFTHNGTKYGGIEFFFGAAELHFVEFNGATNFDIFGLDYYNTQTASAINTEVNNSLNFDEPIMNAYFRFNGRQVWTDANFNPDSKMSKGPLTWSQLRGDS